MRWRIINLIRFYICMHLECIWLPRYGLRKYFWFLKFSYFTYFFLDFFTFPRKRKKTTTFFVLFKSRDTTDSSFALETPPEVLIILHLEKDEAEHGLTYTAFSRATRFSYVGLFDIRFTKKIPWHAKIAPRLMEERRCDSLTEKTIQDFNLYSNNIWVNYLISINIFKLTWKIIHGLKLSFTGEGPTPTARPLSTIPSYLHPTHSSFWLESLLDSIKILGLVEPGAPAIANLERKNRRDARWLGYQCWWRVLSELSLEWIPIATS